MAASGTQLQEEPDDKQARFKAALAEFQSFLSDDTAVSLFITATRNAVRRHPEKFSSFNGMVPGNYDPRYLGEAVDLYERRQDEHHGETALLFDPRTEHMQLLRQVIELIKMDSSVGTPLYKTAEAFGQALDGVQNNRYLPATAAAGKDGSVLLKVIGSYHGAAVAREYGEWQNTSDSPIPVYKGHVVLEMSSQRMPENILETNLMLRHSGLTQEMGKEGGHVEINVVYQGGTSKTFAYNSGIREEVTKMVAGGKYPELEAALNATWKTMDKLPLAAGEKTLSDTALLSDFEREVLDRLTQAHPPKIGAGRGIQ